MNECTCKPDDVEACPACKEYIKEKLGDTIPYDSNSEIQKS